MPEARDTISRQDGVATAHSNQRRTIGGGNRNSEALIMEGGVEDQGNRTPFRWRGAAMVGTTGPMGFARRRGGFGSPRIGRSTNFGQSSPLFRGRENTPHVVGSGRGRGGLRGRGSSILPSWYPRKPLRDITAVVRAIERTRARREESEEALETESPILPDQIVHDPFVSTSAAQLDQDLYATPQFPKTETSHSTPVIGKVPKILLNITNQSEKDLSCLTPQKKLLNNIETVEREVMEELHELKRTPTAKKAERQKRVKTLMSMR